MPFPSPRSETPYPFIPGVILSAASVSIGATGIAAAARAEEPGALSPREGSGEGAKEATRPGPAKGHGRGRPRHSADARGFSHDSHNRLRSTAFPLTASGAYVTVGINDRGARAARPGGKPSGWRRLASGLFPRNRAHGQGRSRHFAPFFAHLLGDHLREVPPAAAGREPVREVRGVLPQVEAILRGQHRRRAAHRLSSDDPFQGGLRRARRAGQGQPARRSGGHRRRARRPASS